jgi:hypothetical protein
MKVSAKVGSSHRTPGKHDALSWLFGKTVGVHSVYFPKRTFVAIDCTAGDGVPSGHSLLTSPSILDKGIQFLESKGIHAKLALYEKSAVSSQSLKLHFPNRDIVHGDAKDMPVFWDQTSILFVVNDPNTINDWILPQSLNLAPDLTTVFSTLGCNVGGLKMLSKEKRAVWYEHVQSQLLLLKPWHAAYIIRIENDSSQWAYLVNSPVKWMKNTEEAFRKSFEKYGMKVDGGWIGERVPDSSKFRNIVDQLFLTKKEFQNV